MLTRLDVLDGMHSVKLCIGYQADGEAVDYFPSQPGLLERCSPVYEELAGWTDPTAGATSLQQLPPQAMAYVKRIEELVASCIEELSLLDIGGVKKACPCPSTHRGIEPTQPTLVNVDEYVILAA